MPLAAKIQARKQPDSAYHFHEKYGLFIYIWKQHKTEIHDYNYFSYTCILHNVWTLHFFSIPLSDLEGNGWKHSNYIWNIDCLFMFL